ncbi:MAG: tetratricopeptide repeat protein [Gemmatimonadaceae bacterium]
MDYDKLRELQEKFEENPRRYFAPLANEYRKGGQPKRAIEICRAQLAQMPGHMSGQIVYGQALYEAGEFAEARQVFERALTLDPENLIALRSLGDMSLQSGDTAQARSWYVRLLDADPKDTAVIALVSEIDSSAEAVPVAAPEEIPGVDTDAGDQPIPFITDDAGAATVPEPPAIAPSTTAPQAAQAPTPEPAPEAAPPAGLERHYPVEAVSSPEDEAPLGAEGLKSALPEINPMGAAGVRGTEPEVPETIGTEGLTGKAPVSALEGATASRSDSEAEKVEEVEEVEEVVDKWTPPAAAPVNELVESRKEDRMFSGPSPEPFVNETMAQLYLQQGYRQLALRVYYQLAEARPDDQGLKDRIAQIEAEDRAAHPEEMVQARREPPVERPSAPPAAPRAPSIETPTPGGPPESEESPSFDRTPVDSPPTRPSRERESIEAPSRDEPRAEPEGIAARQPSVKEFFATLGRRRPPRAASASPASSPARSGNSMPGDISASLANPAPAASLDAVFAGATVNPADSRAASRLAGAFSGATGTSRTPPTPPMPTPRVNPRLPHTQESEEDVAKFRAWLDGLTGE